MMTTFSKKELKNIRTWLPDLGIEKLAEEFGLQPGSVRNILFGTQTNELVVRRALDMASNEKKKVDQNKALLAS